MVYHSLIIYGLILHIVEQRAGYESSVRTVNLRCVGLPSNIDLTSHRHYHAASDRKPQIQMMCD